MAAGRILTGIALLAALAAAPVSADPGQRRRDQSDRRDQQREERSQADARESRRRAEPRRQVEVQRQAEIQRQRDDWRSADRRYRPNNGRFGPRTNIVPRVVRPRIVTVVPYRPYVYRPRLGIGTYYAPGGVYPYVYTPRGYYDPIPGRLYGGLRITDAPRDAQVFADGYYVGIVDDFDGVFQHLNLEVGPHRIEVRMPGYGESVVFDVYIQPGRTITYRADW